MSKLTIITIVYNNVRDIERTIQSILKQTYKKIEYIVIDGASTDGTLQVVERYKDQISKIVSEPDKGIYDAMNKGVAMAGGDIVGILNSDDFYSNNTVIEKVVKAFNVLDCEAVYGDLVFVDSKQTNKVVRKWVAGNYDKKLFYKGWMPPHPTVFIKREVYEKYGLFNLKFKSSSDYELLLRLMLLKNIKVGYIPEVLVQMRTGGQSTKSLSNRLSAHKEDYLAWLSNGITPKWYTLAMKPLSKLKQFRYDEKEKHSNQLVFRNFYQEPATSEGY